MYKKLLIIVFLLLFCIASVYAGDRRYVCQTLIYSATKSLSPPVRGDSYYFINSVTGNIAFTLKGGVQGDSAIFLLTSDAVGSHIMTFGTGCTPTGTMTLIASQMSIIRLTYTGSTWKEEYRINGNSSPIFPLSTKGDILYSSATNVWSNLAGNTTAAKNFLTQTGTGVLSAAPTWETLEQADVTGLTTADSPTFAGVTLGNTGLQIKDTGGDHNLTIKPNENLTGNKTLNLITGDSDRTVTLAGNTTLADWFDQTVKTSSQPSFAYLYLNTSVNQSFLSGLRTVAADSAGNDLSIIGGGATSLATNKNGGNIYLKSGIATGSGSSNIYFQTATAGGAGTDDRSPATKLTINGAGQTIADDIVAKSPWADVRAYGAVGNGTTDDTTAIQAALTASKNVFLPAGTYKITSVLTMSSRQYLKGASMSSTTILVSGGGNGIEITGHRSTVSDLRIINDTTNTGSGIKITRRGYCSIEHVWIGGDVGEATVYFNKGIEILGEPAYFNTIFRCNIRCNTYGMYLYKEGGEAGPNETRIIGTEIIYGDYSVYAAAGQGLQIEMNDLEGYAQKGVYMGASYSKVINNWFESDGKYAIELASGVTWTHIAKNKIGYVGMPYVLDNSGNNYNDIEDYQTIFSNPGLSGVDANVYGGKIALSHSGNTVTDLLLQAALGDLQLSALTAGKVVNSLSDVKVGFDKYVDIWSPRVFTVVGGFGKRTENRLKYSEDFTNSVWGKTNAYGTLDVTGNATIAPDGYSTADLLTADHDSEYCNQALNGGVALSAGTKVRFSVWIRSDSPPTDTTIKITGSTTLANYTFQPTTTWKKYAITATNPSDQILYVMVRPSAAGTGSIYAWGTQVIYGSDYEEMPYIKTLGLPIYVNVPSLVGSDHVYGRVISGTTVVLTNASTISCNMDSGNVFTLSTTAAVGNVQINATGGVAGQKATFIITDDATGGHIVTFGTNFKPNGTLAGTASKTATVEFVYDGTNWYEISRTTGE